MEENAEVTQPVHSPENENPEESKDSGSAEDDSKTEAASIASCEESSKKRRKPESKEPVTPLLDRPSRERKSVERFIDSVEREPKELIIEQGSGTFLRDIPNVVFKFAKRKWSDETVRFLHKLLYNRRVKPQQVKAHILQFSGWIWGGNEEKEKSKLKEKLEKCFKESLWQVCDLFDLNLPKTARKEDMVLKVFEFLDCPYKSSEKLLEEQEQKAKEKKRQKPTAKGKRRIKSSGQTPSKKQKHGGKSSNGGLEQEEEGEEEGGGGGSEEEREVEPEGDEELVEVQPEKKSPAKPRKPCSTKKGGRRSAKKSSDSEDVQEVEREAEPKEVDNDTKEDEDDEALKRKRSKKKKTEDEVSPSPKRSGCKPAKRKSFNELSQENEEATEDAKDAQSKLLNKGSKTQVPKEVEASHVKKKKKEELEGGAPQETLKKARGKRKAPIKESKPIPTDDDLSVAICELLCEADFSTVTFTDVLKRLEAKYDVDLSQRKAHVKVLIQEEISKLVDEDEGEGEDEDKVEPEPVPAT